MTDEMMTLRGLVEKDDVQDLSHIAGRGGSFQDS